MGPGGVCSEMVMFTSEDRQLIEKLASGVGLQARAPGKAEHQWIGQAARVVAQLAANPNDGDRREAQELLRRLGSP